MNTKELRDLVQAIGNPKPDDEPVDIPELSVAEATLVAAVIQQSDTINATTMLTQNLVKAIMAMTNALDRNFIDRNSKIIQR